MILDLAALVAECAPIDELEDDVIPLDAFVIVRFTRPDWQSPGFAYTGTPGMQDESVRIGLLTGVLDRVRQLALRQFDVEDDDD